MSKYILEFEKPIKRIEDEIQALKTSSVSTGINVDDKLNELHNKLNQEYVKIYSNLTRWQKVELARHSDRPHTSDYIHLITEDWMELHGDRKYADDPSIIAGIATISSKRFIIMVMKKEEVQKINYTEILEWLNLRDIARH